MRRDAQLLAGQVLVIGLAWDVLFSETLSRKQVLNTYSQSGSPGDTPCHYSGAREQNDVSHRLE